MELMALLFEVVLVIGLPALMLMAIHSLRDPTLFAPQGLALDGRPARSASTASPRRKNRRRGTRARYSTQAPEPILRDENLSMETPGVGIFDSDYDLSRYLQAMAVSGFYVNEYSPLFDDTYHHGDSWVGTGIERMNGTNDFGHFGFADSHGDLTHPDHEL
ncbi:MAG: hypothetical protein JO142_01945 [Burkholderiales bacterium]|nr:hypothetical protein [Burkholderiales bacterium]